MVVWCAGDELLSSVSFLNTGLSFAVLKPPSLSFALPWSRSLSFSLLPSAPRRCTLAPLPPRSFPPSRFFTPTAVRMCHLARGDFCVPVSQQLPHVLRQCFPSRAVDPVSILLGALVDIIEQSAWQFSAVVPREVDTFVAVDDLRLLKVLLRCLPSALRSSHGQYYSCPDRDILSGAY